MKMTLGIRLAGGIVAALFVVPVHAVGPTFRADWVFSGSSLQGLQTLGQADWTAKDGIITGTPKQSGGGWLMLDKSFQDVAVYANVHCVGACKSGFLFRAEKLPNGSMKGIYLSLTPGDLASYAVTLDGQGKETSRTKLPQAESENRRVAPQAGTTSTYTVLPFAAGADLPATMQRPMGAYRLGAWNQVEVILHEDAVTPSFNGGGLRVGEGAAAAGVTTNAQGKYGPVAIYVGGTDSLEVKDLRYKDLNLLAGDPEYVSPAFEMKHLDSLYYSWTAAAADVNHDGIPDIIAGPYYWLGPDYKVRGEIYTPVSYNPTSQYPLTSMVNLAYDYNGDGWPDVLVMSGNAGNGVGTLYVNPRGEGRHWDQYVVLPHVGNEETLLKDIDGDGKPEIIHSFENCLAFSKPDPANPTGPWITTKISEPGPWGANIGHGLGVGDINSDGRMDFINAYGWWEQPAKGSRQTLWTYHPQAFGRWGASQGGAGGAELAVYDVNGDGLVDVVGPVEGHGYGLAWWEQRRDNGKITFVTHMIMDNFMTENAGGVTFSEPHAAAFADMNGDGILDMITGKRSMSHFGYTDPDPFGPAVLYVYTVVRDPKVPGGAKFAPSLIHNRSGVGSHLVVSDLDGDGRPDIVTSGIFGTFVFLNKGVGNGKVAVAK